MFLIFGIVKTKDFDVLFTNNVISYVCIYLTGPCYFYHALLLYQLNIGMFLIVNILNKSIKSVHGIHLALRYS